ncbi:hypothetical protein FE257_010106 [Aspergillus nanangensis]|uniref:RTA1 domain protein n=1 Tax=Aspergillus nanangensis TaxID=2582783 RepID=A0AAD4CJT6_ASPNN|nr:hypothetical protein FE257_010106 [Aspergillus nanangensis]
MSDGQPVSGSLYIYAPNKGAPVFFTAAFAISAVFHIWQCHRYRCFKLLGLHPLCAVLFAVGYALREYEAFNYSYGIGDSLNTRNLLLYIISQVFIYICPPLLELANYHVLGRIFYYVPYLAPLAPGKVLSIFGALMAIVELVNALGVALAANPSSSHTQQETGGSLTVAALAIQLAVIFTFVLLAFMFQWRCYRSNIYSRTISTPLITLYISMALILARSIYRLVEHLGNTVVNFDDPASLRHLSPLLRYEWYFYIFEATLMLVNSVLWNIWNPGRYLPRNHHIYLSQDGKTELEMENVSDNRSFLLKIVSVLTFGLAFHRKESWRLEELGGNADGLREA